MKLEFRALAASDEAGLKEFYKLYQTSFPLADEQEPIEGFERVLEMNDDPRIQERLGPYHEFIITIHDPASHAMVGGLVLGVSTGPEHEKAGLAASVQGIYLFLDRQFREKHPLGTASLVPEIEHWARTAFESRAQSRSTEVAIFLEVNNPKLMTARDIVIDRDNSGLDPFRRYMFWIGLRCRPLDFQYVQPPLNSEKAAVPYLELFYKGPRQHLPASVLIEHLYKFVSISVLKGRDAYQNPDFAEMAADLQQRGEIAVIDWRGNAKIRGILAQAKLRTDATRPAAFDPFGPPPENSAYRPAQRSFLAKQWARLWNAGYRLIYRLFRLLERNHIYVTYAEVIVGVIGLSILLGSQKLIIEHFHMMEIWKHRSENIILGTLLIYVLCRGLVNMRRSRLGNNFARIQSQLRARRDPAAAFQHENFKWFSAEIVERAAQCLAFWRVAGDTTSTASRYDAVQLMRTYSAQIHSDRVWGVVDEDRSKSELPNLDRWLDAFPDCLVGAKFTQCPGRSFYNLVLPIVTRAGRLGQMGLEAIEVDQQLANAIISQRPLPPERANAGEQRPACLLVLRQVATADANGASGPMNELDFEFAIIATALMHVATLLWKLAPGGDLIEGLPKDSLIMFVSGNRHGATFLKDLGFELILRPAPHEAEEDDAAHESVAQANLSVYRFAIGDPANAKARRLRVLMSDLIRTMPDRGV